MSLANTVVILDFETTGLSPTMGDRAIEIGAVRLVDGQVTGQFQQLMDPGMRISGFIASYTGITNAMLKDAAPCHQVMAEFADFLGDDNWVAHNASFDKRFLDAELARIKRSYRGQGTCSMLAARRIFNQAPNHKLATLIDYADIESEGTFHRALYDAQMTAKLWLALINTLQDRYRLANIPFSTLHKVTKTPINKLGSLFGNYN